MIVDTNFQTPPPVARYMVSLLPKDVRTILEPTPGIGILYHELVGEEYWVTCPEDYFLLPRGRWDAIVMNPPFSSKSANLTNSKEDFKGMQVGYHILQDCMQMSDNIIALMPWFTIIDSDVRLRYLKAFGLISVTALPRKTFAYSRIQTCILQLQKGYSKPTTFEVFNY